MTVCEYYLNMAERFYNQGDYYMAKTISDIVYNLRIETLKSNIGDVK